MMFCDGGHTGLLTGCALLAPKGPPGDGQGSAVLSQQHIDLAIPRRNINATHRSSSVQQHRHRRGRQCEAAKTSAEATTNVTTSSASDAQDQVLLSASTITY